MSPPQHGGAAEEEENGKTRQVFPPSLSPFAEDRRLRGVRAEFFPLPPSFTFASTPRRISSSLLLFHPRLLFRKWKTFSSGRGKRKNFTAHFLCYLPSTCCPPFSAGEVRTFRPQEEGLGYCQKKPQAIGPRSEFEIHPFSYPSPQVVFVPPGLCVLSSPFFQLSNQAMKEKNGREGKGRCNEDREKRRGVSGKERPSL